MLGIVVIGRNEGTRLKLCLQSVLELQHPVVYVDSGSTDGSVALARELNVTTVQLDSSRPFSAARARHEGFRQLMLSHPQLEFVFFVDGDCQIVPTWLATAQDFLWQHKEVGVVCGRRREQYPEHSVYNRLCDDEWNTTTGEAKSAGGDAVYRCGAYLDAGEFDGSVPAGEEPELCKRLRDKGWKIWRIDREMTLHNAAMTHFSQWWNRQLRTGYAGYDVERRFALRAFDRIINSAFFWGLIYPLVAVLAALIIWQLTSGWWALVVLALTVAGYLLQALRIAWKARRRNYNWKYCAEISFFTMVAKLPILIGALRQTIEHARGKRARLIEYKTSGQRTVESYESRAGEL